MVHFSPEMFPKQRNFPDTFQPFRAKSHGSKGRVAAHIVIIPKLQTANRVPVTYIQSIASIELVQDASYTEHEKCEGTGCQFICGLSIREHTCFGVEGNEHGTVNELFEIIARTK